MKALTLTQPWAALVALGQKRIETRSWGTSYRGRLAIHAAKAFPSDARCLCPLEPFDDALGLETLWRGKIVAVGVMTECFRFGELTEGKIRQRSAKGLLPKHEADFGDFAAGRYGFVLSEITKLETPIECRGMLSLWDVPADVVAAINAQTSAVTV